MKTKAVLFSGLITVGLLPICVSSGEGTAQGASERATGSAIAQLEVNFTRVYGMVYDTWREDGDPKAPAVPAWKVDDNREDSDVVKFVEFEVPAKGRLFLDGFLKADGKYTHFTWGDCNPYVGAWDPAANLWRLFPGGPANWMAVRLRHGDKETDLKVFPLAPTVKPAGGLLPNEGAACLPGKYRLVAKAPRAPGGLFRYPMTGQLRVWFFPDHTAPTDACGYVETVVGEGKLFNRTRNCEVKVRDGIYFNEEYETTGHVQAKIIVTLGNSEAAVRIRPGTRVKFEPRSPSRPKPGVFLFLGKVLSLFKSKGRNDGYSVVTSNNIQGVEGTAFETEFLPERQITRVAVYDGKVEVRPVDAPQGMTLQAGQKGTFPKGADPVIETLTQEQIIRALLAELSGDR